MRSDPGPCTDATVRDAAGRARPRDGRGDPRPPGTATPPGVVAHRRSVRARGPVRLIPALLAALGHRARRGVRLGIGGRRERRSARGCPTSTRRRRTGSSSSGPDRRTRREYRLGFRSAVRNVGDRAADHRRPPRGRRPRARWSPTRSSYHDGAPRARVRGVGRLRFVVSPDHRHWHLLRFERYELRRAGQLGRRWSRDRKTGFCLGDRYAVAGRRCRPRAPAPRVHEPLRAGADASCSASAKGSPSATATTTRRTSRASTCRSPGCPDGRYVLVHRVERGPPDPGVRLRQQRGVRALLAALARRCALRPGPRALPGQRALRRLSRSRGLIGCPAPAIASSCCRARPARGRSAEAASARFPTRSAGGPWPTPLPSPARPARRGRRGVRCWRRRRRSRPRARSSAAGADAARRPRAGDLRAGPVHARPPAARTRRALIRRARLVHRRVAARAGTARLRVSLAAPSRLRIVVMPRAQGSPHPRDQRARRAGAWSRCGSRPARAVTRCAPVATASASPRSTPSGTRSRPIQRTLVVRRGRPSIELPAPACRRCVARRRSVRPGDRLD